LKKKEAKSGARWLEEIVVTKKEMENIYRSFFEAYNKGPYKQPTDRDWSWISGFFGSGEVAFLEIVSYLFR